MVEVCVHIIVRIDSTEPCTICLQCRLHETTGHAQIRPHVNQSHGCIGKEVITWSLRGLYFTQFMCGIAMEMPFTS